MLACTLQEGRWFGVTTQSQALNAAFPWWVGIHFSQGASLRKKGLWNVGLSYVDEEVEAPFCVLRGVPE